MNRSAAPNPATPAAQAGFRMGFLGWWFFYLFHPPTSRVAGVGLGVICFHRYY
ncbi:hypothetical protein PF002_g10018 [Phytophthora fragariae]|uniref:Uncharacterized protein n=1 Tax=Phytophthora fragariae TaxID=53985 RepID=A0A6A3ZNQ7_9STRA|nr:hypothetical protein PF003_g18584 [Phytophthora fragariae]KAE8945640.1 hypothetical protein PF009_g4711 [Phytophthora fragariae]KAE9117373.1 hypothetical protein PF007_g9308 [Phytophthora fragariae]KAE9146653.1 hypothetical protein PF006_g8602 [Phytophthora fragariae]KAE9239951.1 hypothetical protein PF002_g10018 [Phytophthora fragariae]